MSTPHRESVTTALTVWEGNDGPPIDRRSNLEERILFGMVRHPYLQGLIPASCGTPQRSTASSGRFAGPERREFLDGENIAAPS
jgi:hypothetical protein